MTHISQTLVAAAIATLFPALAQADTADRLMQLIAIPGVSGYEHHVRSAIEMMLPAGARVRADNLGNILIRTGNGIPHTLIVAPLDESGLVVSAITEDGYLRVHRHTTAPAARIATQFLVGQPVEIVTASGRHVGGVTATPSTHLRALLDPEDDARIKTLDDIWIDVGAETRADVGALGIRMLDSVTLRERGIRLANSRVSGVAAANRALALSLIEIIRRSPGRGATGSVTFAWAAQTEYGNRGLARLLETLKPDRLIVLRSATPAADDARGGVGRLGGGPLVVDRDAMLTPAASKAGVAIQALPQAHGELRLDDTWRQVEKHVVSLPVLFAHTPVETVDARDVDAVAAMLVAAVDLPPLGPEPETGADAAVAPLTPPALARPTPPNSDPALETLRGFIETYGVAGHEQPVREKVLGSLPSWAKPVVDKRGNVSVTVGKGGKPLLFIAHMDEVGFEITGFADDGSAAVRARGGMYLSVYEAHPVVVLTAKGPLPAILAPRRGYPNANDAQPSLESLALFFGTDTAAESQSYGAAVGHSVTVRKQFVRLGPNRATGRSMDDRNGSTALLLALKQLDPATLENTVTFAWSVEEETGLAGAEHLAESARPDTVFAVDTFVSSDTPLDNNRIADAPLGRGAVLRVLDNSTIVRPAIVDRIVGVATTAKVPLQLGTTRGGTDAGAFSAGGAIDVGLSWPGRYSHSPVEVMDRRDLDALVRLIVALAKTY